MIVVGLSWAFADLALAKVGLSGWTAHLTMAVVYLILGFLPAEPPFVASPSHAVALVGTVIGTVIYAVVFRKHAAGSVEEAALSAAMISAVRSAQAFGRLLKVRAAALELPTTDSS